LPNAWPNSKSLDGQVKFLLETMKQFDGEENRPLPQLKITERTLKRRSMGFKDRCDFKTTVLPLYSPHSSIREWTKREMNDFRMALMQFGAGPWELIREKADLRKSSSQIEKYFKELMEQCKLAMMADSTRKGNEYSEEQDDDVSKYTFTLPF
jgi:hypothetical protein